MAIARQQARGLLTDSEMVLFGDSRNPALRSLTGRELTRRIDRVRKLRNKARDLLQRQRLGSRQRTGNKGGKSGTANERTAQKGDVLEDVLQRFQARLQELERSGPSGETGQAAGAARKTGPAKKAAAAVKKAGAAKKGGATKKAGAAKETRKASATKKAQKAGPTGKAGPASKTAGAVGKSVKTQKTAGKAAAADGKARKKSAAATGPRKSAVSTEQALASTQELLEARQKQARKPRGYPGDQGNEAQTDPGYQSGQAKSKALELHAGEIRMEPIHGSISTRDRKNQAKRDRT